MVSSLSGGIVTNLHLFSEFHLAEGYHQKYMLRSNMSLLVEYEAKYPDVEGMVSSTATARVNGYLGGNGTCNQLKSEVSGFGLSESSREKLLKVVCTGIEGKLCPSNNCSAN